MDNLFYVNPKVVLLDAAAVAVAAHMQANSHLADIPAADLVALPEVKALLVGGKLPDGYKDEVLQRVKKIAESQ